MSAHRFLAPGQLLSETHLRRDQYEEAAQTLLDQHYSGKPKKPGPVDNTQGDPLVSNNG